MDELKSTGYRLNKNKFIYSEFKPASDNALIEMLWSFDLKTNNKKKSVIGLLPNKSPGIIYFHDRSNGTNKIFMCGPSAQNINLAFSKDCLVLGASLKLFAYNKISDYPLTNFSNKLITFSKAFGSKLENRILGFLEKKKEIYFFEKILIKLLMPGKFTNAGQDKFIKDAAKSLMKSEGKIKISDVYKNLGIGSRQFIRNFIAQTGLTPKQFSRIIRIKCMARRIVMNNEKQADLMFEGGFFDQSHYCNEFKKLTGNYPAQFESNQKRIKYKNLIKVDDDTFLQ